MTSQKDLPGHSDQTESWLGDEAHAAWLRKDALAQLAFFRKSLRADGGFDVLNGDGTSLADAPQELHTTTRLVHSYALGHVAGAPDCANIIEAGLAFLWSSHRDPVHGGYFWAVTHKGEVVDDKKLAYGHVFVLLAAASAKAAGFSAADQILADITRLIDMHFWDDEAGLLTDEYLRDWQPFSDYRGYNSNMHGCEAFLAAYEATGEQHYLDKAGRILNFFTAEIAPAHQWRVPEHFTLDWQVDHDYAGNPMFRPKGTTPGHSFELARLLIQYWDLAGRPDNSDLERARHLVTAALNDAWVEEGGGFVYTLDYDGDVQVADRYWWPVTEAIGVLSALIKLDGTAEDERWYRRVWQAASDLFVDHEKGGWFPEIDATGKAVAHQFTGKPDIYHALQADLLPLTPGVSGTMAGLAKTKPLG